MSRDASRTSCGAGVPLASETCRRDACTTKGTGGRDACTTKWIRGVGEWPRRWPVIVLALGLAVGTAAVAWWWLGRRSGARERHLRAASRALSAGRLEDAAAELGQAHEQGEPFGAVERLWGLVYARAGRPDDALPRLWRAWEGPRVGGGGPDPEVAEALARITMERFALGDAVAVLDRWATTPRRTPSPWCGGPGSTGVSEWASR